VCVCVCVCVCMQACFERVCVCVCRQAGRHLSYYSCTHSFLPAFPLPSLLCIGSTANCCISKGSALVWSSAGAYSATGACVLQCLGHVHHGWRCPFFFLLLLLLLFIILPPNRYTTKQAQDQHSLSKNGRWGTDLSTWSWRYAYNYVLYLCSLFPFVLFS